MANIAITTYCNLRCPYCFADEMIEQTHKNIDLDQFRRILSWISRTPNNHIGLIGGEPTLHPQFSEILKEVNNYTRELRTTATLFTNGIELDKFVQDIGNMIGLLINVNAPENMSADKWRKLNATLEHLNLLGWFVPGRARANIGCNLWPDRKNYDWIWEIVDRYQIDHVRVSVTAPITDEYKCRKQWYYATMKPIFMDFVNHAKERNVHLGADCNQIPDCYFTREELDLIYSVMEGRHSGICNPVVDITPDFTATACFGAYDPVDCSMFETLIDLERYLLHKKTYPRVVANRTGKCTNCQKAELLSCQGGCLAFSEANGLKQVFDTPPSLHNKTTERTAPVAIPASCSGNCGTCGECEATEPVEEVVAEVVETPEVDATPTYCIGNCLECPTQCANSMKSLLEEVPTPSQEVIESTQAVVEEATEVDATPEDQTSDSANPQCFSSPC